jgi:hypothetical protein
MIQLFALNKNVYDQIKHDREILIDRIKTSQSLLEEFDSVFPILESVFNPKIKITESTRGKESFYNGSFSFLHPDGTESRQHIIVIGKSSDYKGKDDERLINDAIVKAQKKIKDECPEFFK